MTAPYKLELSAEELDLFKWSLHELEMVNRATLAVDTLDRISELSDKLQRLEEGR